MSYFLNALFEHMAWADARVLALLSDTPGASGTPGVLRLIGHVAAAERIWLIRLRGADSTAQPIWPEWSLDQIKHIAADNARDLRTFVASLSDETAVRGVEYRNSQGVVFRTATIDILTHVALHGSYHRGQIAAALRAASVTPVNTDFTTYVRQRS